MTYTIHRYPAELIDVVRLADGGPRVTIRPVLPQDMALVAAFFRELSEASRRNRFFRTLRELPEELLERLTSVDYRAHLALIATVLGESGETVIGEARYVITDRDAAEFALAVADAWQGRGVGRELLARLFCRAAAQGVARLHGDVLPTNDAMRHLARSAGMTVLPTGEGLGLLRAEKHLAATAAATPCIDLAVARRLAA